jgi:hypothetical protein
MSFLNLWLILKEFLKLRGYQPLGEMLLPMGGWTGTRTRMRVLALEEGRDKGRPHKTL